MYKIVTAFFAALINDVLGGIADVIENITIKWLRTSFRIEESISGGLLTTERIENAFWVVYGIAVVIMAMKVLQKGFMVYVLWRDGDADNDPAQMVVGCLLAVGTAIAFPVLYNILVNVVVYIGQSVLAVFTQDMIGEEDVVGTIITTLTGLITGSAGALVIIEVIAFVIVWVILYCKLMMRGVEMLIYRIGVPLAAIGQINSDGGTWKSYAQLLFQQAALSLTQLFCAILGVALALSGQLFFSILCLITGIKSPKLLAKMFPTMASGGGITQAAATLVSLARLAV